MAENRSRVQPFPSFPDLVRRDRALNRSRFAITAIPRGVVRPDDRIAAQRIGARDVTERVRSEIAALPSVSVAVGWARVIINRCEIPRQRYVPNGLTLVKSPSESALQNVELPGGQFEIQGQRDSSCSQKQGRVGSEIESIPLITQTRWPSVPDRR